jgi:effector-binding domain-containing protein
LQKGVADSHARVAGSLTFIYHGATDDANAEFDMEIGFPIEEKVAANGNFKVRDVPDYKCMSVLFTGSFDQFSSAYEKLMPAAMAAPDAKTGESREMYLYFEETKSPNNVVHVSVGIK